MPDVDNRNSELAVLGSQMAKDHYKLSMFCGALLVELIGAGYDTVQFMKRDGVVVVLIMRRKMELTRAYKLDGIEAAADVCEEAHRMVVEINTAFAIGEKEAANVN